jgi:hypothetical protein
MSAAPERITFPADIWPLADERWKELGYPSLSAYITGLIRYWPAPRELIQAL